jgi:hypothetical protein
VTAVEVGSREPAAVTGWGAVPGDRRCLPAAGRTQDVPEDDQEPDVASAVLDGRGQLRKALRAGTDCLGVDRWKGFPGQLISFWRNLMKDFNLFTAARSAVAS